MAWLSGLAGKAENLLNKIDQNTAAVLNKDKYDLSQPQLAEVTWIPSQPCFDENHIAKSTDASPRNLPYVRSTPSLQSLAPIDVQTSKDEELLFLNTPDISPRKFAMETSPPTPSSLLVEHPTDNTDSVSEISIHSGESSPHYTHIPVDAPDSALQSEDIRNESLLLRHEIKEPSITSAPSDSVASHNNFKDDLDILQQEYTYELNHKNSEMNKILNSVNGHGMKENFVKISANLGQRKLIEKQETDYQKQITLLTEKLQFAESDKGKLLQQISDLQSALEKSRTEVNATRSELEQHRARALKTLQEKEKLILELKTKTTSGTDDAVIMELNQLRQERDSLREENQQICEQLKIVREELCNADFKLEKMRQQSVEANMQAQEILATERRRRLDVEEDARLHSEEIRSLKDELLCQHNRFTSQLQKQDTEISRLRLQLSASSTPSTEVESRLASLTQTLVLKQQALESLTTERNALRLQLEKMEHEFRDAIGNGRRNISYNNDTDDAKAQVPTFLMETPFDTGVTRRVKRAYSSLDAISIRTGVFLRRYPLARILVLLYMALLQFWVLVVLLSQSPDAQ